jgi:FkbM family methyltransferase
MNRRSIASRLLLAYGAHFPNHPGKWLIHNKLRSHLHADFDHEFEVRRKGLRWVLTPSDYCQSSLFWLGERDRWELYHLKKLLSRDSVIIDIGANFGHLAIRLARSLGPESRMIAVEPSPANLDRLRRNIALNRLEHQIEVVPVGLSDVSGTASIVEEEGNSGHTQTRPAGESPVQIALSTVDAVVRDRGLKRIDALLIDVEGLEDRVLRGAVDTIKRFQPLLVVELWPPVLRSRGSSVAEVAKLIHDIGYQLYAPARKRLLPLHELPTGLDGVYVFCLPATRTTANSTRK